MTTIGAANYGSSEIEIVLSKSRVFNAKIGSYIRYAPYEIFNYSAKLSNGHIILTMEELQDCNSLTKDRLQAIAGRFQLSPV